MTKSKIQNEKQGRNKTPLYMELTKIGKSTRLFIHNIRAVEEFCEDVVVLKLKSGAIRIKGAELFLSIYENKSVEINGIVFSVELI